MRIKWAAIVILGWACLANIKAAETDLNRIDYKQWYREPFNDQSSFGDVETVYLVENVRPEYKPKPDKDIVYRKEDLVALTGSIFTNPKGNFEVVIVIYDTDRTTPLLAVYAEDRNQLESLPLVVYYWVGGKWKKVPADFNSEEPDLFWYLYEQTGKLVYYP